MESKQAIKEPENKTLVEKAKDMNNKIVMLGCTAFVSILIAMTAYFYNASVDQDRVLMNESKTIAMENRDDINEMKIQLAVISQKLDYIKRDGNE